MTDYKRDAGKPPLLDALLPFGPALMALAAMMDDMQHRHRLAGASNPFAEWKNLPEAKRRMGNGLARHLLEHGPWTVNKADALPGTDGHLHAVHGLFNLLGAITMHLEDNKAACCGAADAAVLDGQLPYCQGCGADLGGRHAPHCPIAARPLHGPAGADWRENTRRPGHDKACVCLHCTEPYAR